MANSVLPLYNRPMTSNDSKLVDYAISALADREQIKVWSVIVSIFGDLAQNSSDEISGPYLSAITERIGIRPEAMRVAIHRLRKDNWIESRKVGRVSQYRLSPFGHAESKAASPRIYGKLSAGQPLSKDKWHLILLPPGTTHQTITPNQIEISQSVVLGHGPITNLSADNLSVLFEKLEAPLWVREAILPEPLRSAYEAFFTVLTYIRETLHNPHQLSEIDALVLRVLIVHNWRRLLLRHSEAVDAFFPEGWIGNECRALVIAILDELPRADLSD